MATVITIDQKTAASVKFVDRLGNPAKIDGLPAWSSSNEAVVTVEAAADGFGATIKAVNVGSAQVIVRADAEMGDGTREVIATANLEVVAGEAVVATVDVGAPEAN